MNDRNFLKEPEKVSLADSFETDHECPNFVNVTMHLSVELGPEELVG